MARKITVWLLSLLLVISLAPPGWRGPGQAQASPGLDGADRIIPLWNLTYSGLPDVDYEVDAAEAHEGGRSLKIVYRSARASNVFLNLSQTVQAEPSTKYELSMWVKGNNVKGVSFGENWNARTSTGTGTFGWKRVTRTYTTGSNEKSFIFRILVEDVTQAVWLDDISIKKQGTDTNLLRNAGFDGVDEAITLNGFEDLSGWTTSDAGGNTVAEAVYNTRTEGGRALKLTFAPDSLEQDFNLAYTWNPATYLDLTKMTTVTMDVYALEQTVSGSEVMTLRLTDAAGKILEQQLPRIMAGKWSTVKLELDSASSLDKSRIAAVTLYAKRGDSTANWGTRTAASYLVDRLSGVKLKQVQPITASPEPGGVPPGTTVALSTSTAGAQVWYTLDGSDPLSSAARILYAEPIPVQSGTAIKACGVLAGYDPSPVALLAYTWGTGVPGESLAEWSSFQENLGAGTQLPVFYAAGITVDGSLDDWDGYAGLALPNAGTTQNQVNGWTGPEDVSVEARFAYDAEAFYLAAKVTDDQHVAIADADMWTGDSLQFAFGENGVYGAEYGLNLKDGETQVWRWKNGTALLDKSTVTAKVAQQGNQVLYEARIPWEAAFSQAPGDGPVSFSMLVNDNDGSGRKGWLEWTSGIGRVKDGKQLGSLFRVPQGDSWSFWVNVPKEAVAGADIPYTLNLANYSSEPRQWTIQSELLGINREVTVPAGIVLTKEGSFTLAEKGEYTAAVTVLEQATGAVRSFSQQLEVIIGQATIDQMLDAVAAKLPALEQLLLQAEGQGLATDYERVAYTTIKDFIGYGREDAKRGRLTRSYYVAETLEQLYGEAFASLQAYLGGTAVPQAVPRYVSGPLTASGNAFTGLTRVRSTGEEEVRPVFLTGYGHFGQARQDIPKFQDYGANTIQIEVGPNKMIIAKEGYIPEYSTGGSAKGSVSVDTEVKRSGNASVKIVNTSAKLPNVYKQISQSIKVKPNTAYVFKAWVKGENVKNAWMPGGPSMTLRKALPAGTYDWQEITYNYTTGAGETSFSFTVLSENEQIIWVDDLSAVEAGTDVNLMLNPGFEETVDLGDDPDKDYFISTKTLENVFASALANAEEHDIAVSLLMSPHYFPDWMLSKYPELRSSSTGFIKFNINHPKAREVIEDYLRAIIPVVKSYASLHNITLSNEPTYQTNRDPAFYLPLWQSYLEEIYGSIGELNTVYGTAYASFGQVPMPSTVTATPAAYDWVAFNNEQFGQWHEWMADIIHDVAPDIPVMSKVMVNFKNSLTWGVDYERFSEFSQINGNDAYNVIAYGPNGFISELGFYDLQRSINPAPIFNSEHHVIKDGDDQYTPEQAERFRAVLWQGAVHGKSGSTIWVWERTYDVTSDFEGSVLHRPDVVNAIGRTNLDLNRLSYEITALQNKKPLAAILYSSGSGLYNDVHYDALQKSYAALAYSGQRIGFVTEKQIAAGKLADYKLLVVPAAAHVNADALPGIEQFAASGGKVVLIGEDSLTKDGHNQPQNAAAYQAVAGQALTLPAQYGAGVLQSPTATEIRAQLLPLLEELNALEVMVTDTATQAPAVELGWQTGVYNGRLLLNVVNYTGETRQLQITRQGEPVAAMKDLISGRSLSGAALELPPYAPYLLDLGAAEPGPGPGGNDPGETGGPGGNDPGETGGGEDNGGSTESPEGNQDPVNNPNNGTVPPPASQPEPGPGAGSGNNGQQQPGPGQGSTPEQSIQPEAPRDIAGHWAEATILKAIRLGLAEGYEDGTFRAERPVTREELAVLAARWLKSQGQWASLPVPGQGLPFRDGEAISSWAEEAIAAAVQAGWLEGYEDGSFRPQQAVTRAELAVFLQRMMKLRSSAETAPGFADQGDIPGWAADAVSAAATAGLFQGDEQGRFLPADAASRAQTISVLVRLLQMQP
ncbi:S-layer homology domain-containing protein [Paenibacillus sp. YN15]|uniref:S-layer homology domain-containing protein n=1 Tax=Paenibacillus sp. YN15 TaxID=1742774 RepID=UPI000DCBC451|nr:S-layer homology domain-containing protein [Paenibacillus sp. YN15]RAU98158.1 hypothetical protein DQG13_17880 [Paenibacillus sp. YN15]